MTLAPSLNETLTRVRSDLRMGVPLVLVNGDQALVMCAV